MSVIYGEAIHRFRSARKAHTVLYPGVLETLRRVKGTSVPIVAHTESLSFYNATRIRALGLDGVIDVFYSSPDHEFPSGVSPRTLRSQPEGEYDLQLTEHRHVPRGVLRPDPRILEEIISEMKADTSETVYVGDGLMKDVAMAQAVGAIDVFAEYSVSHNREGYALLQRVSHWTIEDVEREKRINDRPPLQPTYKLSNGFGDLPVFI
jgi:FMN phosphatase YigB (HAD superfamily)